MICGCKTWVTDTIGKVTEHESKFVSCDKLAIWKHPRYPDSGFCQHHYEITNGLVTDEWKRIDEDILQSRTGQHPE